MAFRNYLRYDGVELTNVARLVAYTDTMGLGFFKCGDICPALSDVLADAGLRQSTYTTPDQSQFAPWYDPVDPDSARFAGIHVLDATNWESSMWRAAAVQSLTDGGFVQRGRFTAREMTFRVLLLGVDMAACRYGFNWLTTILRVGSPCLPSNDRPYYHIYRDLLPNGPEKPWWARYKDTASIPADDDVFQAPLVDGFPQTYAGLRDTLSNRIPLAEEAFGPDPRDSPCDGFRMDFFATCPTVDDWHSRLRYMLDVNCTSGPAILASNELAENCGGGTWVEVEFTLTAGNPFAFRPPINVAKNPDVNFYRDYLALWAMYKNALPPTDDNVFEAPLMYRDIPHSYAGLNQVLWRKGAAAGAGPIQQFPAAVPGSIIWVDPDCPPVAQFPPAPMTDLLCEPLHTGPWTRITYRAGTKELPRFTEAELVMEFTATGQDFHDMRVRLTPEGGDPERDYVAEFYMTYIPDGATLRIDGTRRSIVMWSGLPGDPAYTIGPASHLVVRDATAASYQFPTLICDGVYTVTVDITDTDDPANLGVKVLVVGREG